MSEPKEKNVLKHRLLFTATVVFAVLNKDKQPEQQGQQTVNVLLTLGFGEPIRLSDIGRVQVNAQKRVFSSLGPVDVQPMDVIINSMCDLGWTTDEDFQKTLTSDTLQATADNTVLPEDAPKGE